MGKKSKPNRSYYRRMGRDGFLHKHMSYSFNPFPKGTFKHELFQQGWDKAKLNSEQKNEKI